MRKPEEHAVPAFYNPKTEFEIDALFGDRDDSEIPIEELSVIFDFSLPFPERLEKLRKVQRRKLN